jgi:hypothetical protein
MPRVYGRALCGTRIIVRVPHTYGQHVTMLSTPGIQSGHAVMTMGATDVEVFWTSVKRLLGPTLRSGDSLLMDNLRAHKAVGVQQAPARTGTCLQYLPPYSPDLSPIEPCREQV